MTVRKLSISVPPEIAELIKGAAAREGTSVSAWVAHAAETQVTRDTWHAKALKAAEELVAEAEALHGPPSKETLRWVDEVMAELRSDDESRNDLPVAA